MSKDLMPIPEAVAEGRKALAIFRGVSRIVEAGEAVMAAHADLERVRRDVAAEQKRAEDLKAQNGAVDREIAIAEDRAKEIVDRAEARAKDSGAEAARILDRAEARAKEIVARADADAKAKIDSAAARVAELDADIRAADQRAETAKEVAAEAEAEAKRIESRLEGLRAKAREIAGA